MGIQQLLLAQGQAGPGQWTIVDYHRYAADGSTFTLNNLQQNDIIFMHLGADVTATIGTADNFTTLSSGRLASITYIVSRRIHNSSSSSVSYTIADPQPDYGLAIVVRSPNQTGSYNNMANLTYLYGAGTPTHNNVNLSLQADSFQLLAAMVDDDDASPMSGPTGTTLIAEDTNSPRGSIGLAYQIINTAGTYSWGSWTTTGTDNWVTNIREMREV